MVPKLCATCNAHKKKLKSKANPFKRIISKNKTKKQSGRKCWFYKLGKKAKQTKAYQLSII